MLVQAGLCRTCSETTLLVFPRGGSTVVIFAATEPDPVKCTIFDKRRKELKFTNCSKSQTEDERLEVDTFCIVECDNKHEHLTVSGETGGTVYAWCAADVDDEEGKWQYNHDYFDCEGML